ncbi:unnamed protein product [Durusdinium trenchii]|uniref:Uncharacterized protein n=1 Tax=Durusdinium trenchii TaxID=1381693 RepID=A0ABP0S0W8_9DINO
MMMMRMRMKMRMMHQVEDSQVHRALWMRPETTAIAAPTNELAPVARPPTSAQAASGCCELVPASQEASQRLARPRTYQRYRPHMRLLPEQTLPWPRHVGGSGGGRLPFTPVEDPTEGVSYMMCSFCKCDRTFRVLQNFLRHMESGECPIGQRELLKLRGAEAPPLAAPATPAPGLTPAPRTPAPTAERAEAEVKEVEVKEAPQIATSFQKRRGLLSELRLLQPRKYAEMAADACGLLNRSVQELSTLVQRARQCPESSASTTADPPAPHGGGSTAARSAKEAERTPVEELIDRLKWHGFEFHPLFSFEDCRSEFLLRDAKQLPCLAPDRRTKRPVVDTDVTAKRAKEDSEARLGSQLVALDVV